MGKLNCVPNFTVVLLRVVSLIIGFIDIVLTAHSYSSDVFDEPLFLGIIIIMFVFSLVFLIGYLADYIQDESKEDQCWDIWFHFVGGFLTLILGMFMIAASIDRKQEYTSTNMERVFAGVFGVQNGLLYYIIGFIVYNKLPKERKPGEGLEWEDPIIESHESRKSNFGSI